jgi:hypothetical protein
VRRPAGERGTSGAGQRHVQELPGRRMDRRALACLGVRAQGETAAGVPTSGGKCPRASCSSETIPSILVHERFSPNFATIVPQTLYTKVVHHTTLYNFPKSSRVFFSTNFTQIACQVGRFLGASE